MVILYHFLLSQSKTFNINDISSPPMPKYPLFTLLILVVSFIAMGCNEESSNDSPSASLILEPPSATIYDNETGIDAPEITFNATGSNDPDGEIRNLHYDYGEGNSTNSREESVDRTYDIPGYFLPSLTVQDNDGAEDSVNSILIINYQYMRQNQFLESTVGTSGESEHPFPVSEYNPDSGVITVEIEPSALDTPNVNITVENKDGEEVAREERETLNGNETVIIDLDKNDFDQYGYGEWKVIVEVENGSITYDVAVRIIYDR